MKTKPNILLVSAGYTTTAIIMNKLMMEYAKATGINLISKDATKVNKADIENADTVLLVRGADSFLAKICKAAAAAGKLCIFYIDDDLLSMYGKNSPYRKYLLDCLNCSDIVWTSNKHIALKYGDHINANARMVVANVIEPWDKLCGYTYNGGNVKFVFAGSPSHEPVLKKYLLPASRSVHESGIDFKLILVGYRGTSLDGIEPYIQTTEWFDNADEYRKYVESCNAQIGIALIEDSEFGKCKFFNKYLEYTKLGLMGMYSNLEPYISVIVDGHNGILVNNTVEDWKNALISVIKNHELRKYCVENAGEDLAKNYNTDATIDAIRSALPEIESFISEPSKVKYDASFSYFLFKFISKLRQIKHIILRG